jgi:hypothetical protein
MFGWINWDRAGPLGRKCRTVGWEGRAVVLASWHLQSCSPRLSRLRTDGLAPASKYWTYQSSVSGMGPINLVACCRQMFGFNYCFNDYVGRKTGWQACRSLSRAGGCVRSTFSREQWGPSNAVDGLRMVTTYIDCPQEAYTRCTWTGVGSVRVMCIRFFPTECTSIQIVMTLGYEYRLFVAVFT